MNALSTDNFKFERRVSVITGVFVIACVIFLVIRNQPFSDANLVVLMRIILALAVAVLGGTIPGFLSLEYNATGFAIRAAGALGLFVITFFGTPRVESLHLPDTEYLKLQSEVTRHLSDRNNCRTALQEAERLTKLSPKDAIAQNLKGNAHYCLQEPQDALAAFAMATKYDPSYRPAQFNKAAALIRLSQYQPAADLLQSLIKADSGYTSARYNLAVAEASLGKFAEAFDNFKFVYQADGSFDASFGLGFSYILDAPILSVEQSLHHFKIAISMKPGIVCLLYGKLPIEVGLRELKPYLDIQKYASDKPEFLVVRTNFDRRYEDTECEGKGSE